MPDNTRRLLATSRPSRIVGTRPNSWHGGVVGAGRVLVVLSCIALVMFIDRLAQQPTVGLPVLAIFSIMILLGTLALTSSLFFGLGLASIAETLGLPPGSIRAAIACLQ